MEDYIELKRKKLMELAAIQKDFVITNSVYDKWKKERDLHLYNSSNDAAIIPARLREILKNEIVIEFDNCTREQGLSYSNAVISTLKTAGISFEVYDHGSRSYHIHVLIEGLDALQPRDRHDYKKAFVERYVIAGKENVDNSLFGIKLIALEYAPHFKHGSIKLPVEKFGDHKNSIDSSILSFLAKTATINNSNPTSLLFRIPKTDTKFWDLLNGDWQKYRYLTKSEAEEAFILKLLYYGYLDPEIYHIMMIVL